MASEWIEGLDDDDWINHSDKKRVGKLFLVHYPTHRDKREDPDN